jgi:4-oxalocrotonate tautomerase
MPIAMINIIEGRSPEKIRRMVESVSQAMATSLNAPIESVRVLVTEYPATHWGRNGRSMADDKKAEAPAAAAPPSGGEG